MGLDITITLSKKRMTYCMLLVVIMFLYMPPLIFAVDPSRNLAYKISRSSAAIISATQILVFVFSRRVTGKIYPLLIGVFLFTIEVSNLHFGYAFDKTTSFVIDAINIFGVSCMLFNLHSNERMDLFFNSFIAYTSILSISNLLTQVFNYKYGLYHNFKLSWQAYYLCGNPNAFVFFYTITLAVIYATAYRYNLYRLKVYGYFVNACMIYSTYLGKSTTGMVCAFLFLILNFIFDTRIVRFIVNNSVIFLTAFVVFAISVFWFIGLRGWYLDSIKELISNTVHEKRNLLTRGEIWDFAIKRIKKEPILGYGSINPQLSFSKSAGIKRSAHNTFLQILLYGGVTAFGIYLLLLVIAVIKASFGSNKWRVEYVLAFFIYMLSFVFEQNPFYIGFYILLVLMFLESGDRQKG